MDFGLRCGKEENEGIDILSRLSVMIETCYGGGNRVATMRIVSSYNDLTWGSLEDADIVNRPISAYVICNTI